jgi:hypothetical protein
MQVKVFHAVGVVVCEVKSDTLFSVMAVGTDPDAIDFTRTDLRFDVDLSRTPKRVSTWSKAVIDDRGVFKSGKELPPVAVPMTFALPLTCLGSGTISSPTRGAFIGGVYLEHSVYSKLHDTYFPDYPVLHAQAELTSIVTLDSDAHGDPIMNRFHGFLAKVTNVAGDQITVGFSNPADAGASFMFTAGNASAYLLQPPPEALAGQPSLADNLTLNATGALFLELKTAVAVPLKGPKVPIGFI